ncbi:MAG: mechanosensitive ion channel family protein [Zestosphaera sp.]
MDALGTTVYGEVTVGDILVFAVVMTLAVVAARLVTMTLKRALIDKVRKTQLEAILKTVYYGIIVLAFLGLTPMIGINLSGLLLAGGIAGIVMGFALQNIVANLVSGIFIAVERPVRIGDAIAVGDVIGVVEDINIFSTIVRTFDGVFVRVPNASVFTSNITNYAVHVARRFEYTIGIRYSDDAQKAVELIKEVIEEHPLALKKPDPQVFVDSLGESAVNIVVRVWAPAQEWFSVKMELLWAIKERLEENGIQIPFPQRVVWFANELPLRDQRPSGGESRPLGGG